MTELMEGELPSDGLETPDKTIGYPTLLSHNNDKSYHAIDDEISYKRKGTVLSSSINICNANIGTGILGLAFGVATVGWLSGVILLIIFGFINGMSFNLLMSMGRAIKNSKSSWALISQHTLPKLQIWIDLGLVFARYLIGTAYLIIIGDYMPLISDHFGMYNNRTFWMLAYVIVLIIPISLLKELNALKYTSFMAILCFIYLVVLIFAYYPSLSKNDGNIEINMYPTDILSFFKAVPVFMFALGGHGLAFNLSNELKNNTQQRINQTIISSYSFIVSLYIAVGLTGYFTFGNNVSANILIDYPNDDTPIIILRLLLCIAISFSYPIVAIVFKDSASSLIFQTHKQGKDAQNLSNIKYYFIVSLYIISTTITALLVSSLGVILQLHGATTGTFLQIIVPGLLYYYSDNISSNILTQNGLHKIKQKFSLFLVVFGVILIPLGVLLIFI